MTAKTDLRLRIAAVDAFDRWKSNRARSAMLACVGQKASADLFAKRAEAALNTYHGVVAIMGA